MHKGLNQCHMPVDIWQKRQNDNRKERRLQLVGITTAQATEWQEKTELLSNIFLQYRVTLKLMFFSADISFVASR